MTRSIKQASLLALAGMALMCMALILFSVTQVSSAQTIVTKPLLGTAGSFAVLGGSTVTNTGPSVINGDLGVSPGSAITGFPPGLVHGATHKNDAVAMQAQDDVTFAYNTAFGQKCDHQMTGKDLGSLSLKPGVYCFSSSAQLTGDLTLDGPGVYIFQAGTTLTTGSNSHVSPINGANPCDIFWQVGSSATIGTDSHFAGNILALTSISAQHRATFNGGLYARKGAVTLNDNTVSRSECNQSTPTPTSTKTPKKTPTKTPEITPVTGLG
jgi:Ice-binding-like